MNKSQSSDKRADILVPYPVGRPYTYGAAGFSLSPGDFTLVPIGRRESLGVVWGNAQNDVPAHKLKNILCDFQVSPMPDIHRRFLEWVASYTMADLGSVLKMSLPATAEQLFKKPPKKQDIPPCAEIVTLKTGLDLSNAQAEASKTLCRMVEIARFEAVLLDGVTGSGKTEVYFEALAEAFRQNKQVLVLLPEIGLSTAFINRFERRFGVKPAIWHSEVTPANKRKIWRGVLEGKTKCVVGARSALFLPFPNLGLIVVDEEHDASYKQEDGVIYHARDMAVMRAKLGDIPIVLASATPSLESIQNVWAEKYRHVVLPDRFGEAVMPDIDMIDMRAEKTGAQIFLSETLRQALIDTKQRGEQSLLFLNRRGYAPLTLCRKCGHRFECPACSAWLVEHRKTGRLHCHHCNFNMRLPRICPECETEDSLIPCGPGVERIAEEAAAFLPDARILILSSDITDSPKQTAAAFDAILKGEVDIIIGTQMIAKGHHFPKLTMVGVVDADIGLSGGDMRAAERVFQLLHQVAGRAGRAELKGHVYLQSYMPDHTVMQALAAGARDGFLKVEAAEREDASMPPYGKLAALIISSTKEDAVKSYCRALARAAPHYKDVRILGPAPAMMAMLRGKHRWRFLIKAKRNAHMQKILEDWVSQVKQPSNIRLKIDIDPQSFF